MRLRSLFVAALVACPFACHAGLTRLEFTTKRPYGQFAAGEYVLWEGRVLGEQVPKRDADGNDVGGVRLPGVDAPLGTHVALNRPLTRSCMLIAFEGR